jgi:hypothetical protein
MRKYILILLTLFVFLLSCEDPVPTDYVEQTIVESYLVVDEPIRGLRIMRTLPLTDTFLIEEALIGNANVKIYEGENIFELQYAPLGSDFPGYFYPDHEYKVKSGTKYELEITLDDGSKITGETFTPPTTEFTQTVPDFIYFPQDTINLPANDSLRVEWENVEGFGVYGLSIKCIDTLDYGKYLEPPVPNELNRRILKPWSDDDDFYEISRWYPVANTSTPVVWSAFKYYGMHELAVYVPDFNFLRWFLQNATRGQADPLLNSLEGDGFGCFGSVSVIRDTSFLIKNQP